MMSHIFQSAQRPFGGYGSKNAMARIAAFAKPRAHGGTVRAGTLHGLNQRPRIVSEVVKHLHIGPFSE